MMKDGQTIGQWLKWDFETNGNLVINEKNSKRIYCENSDGDWSKREYDSLGNEIYFENSNGDWSKREWDSQGNEICYEDSDGRIEDNRTPEIITHTNGHKYKLIK